MEWIKTSDRMPPSDESSFGPSDRVLIVYRDESELDVMIACFVRTRLDSDQGMWFPDDGEDDLSCDQVTHWMPLPDLPKSSA